MMTSLNFFYHGTNHSSVENIIAGIDLGITMSKNLEFGRGFYVTNTLSVANEWAQAKSPNTAVLVFRVSGVQLRNDGNMIGLNLMNDEEEWKSMLKSAPRCLTEVFVQWFIFPRDSIK